MPLCNKFEPVSPHTIEAAETPRFHSWIVRKEVSDGFFTSCRYNSPTPCTAEDVAKAPSVVNWIGNDTLAKIYHPEW